MKRLWSVLIGLAALALAPAVAWAAPGTGLASSDHDFSGAAATPVGLCTFCHTPHRAISTSLLWNHTLSSASFSWDETSTTAGTTYPTFAGDVYKGPTTKCLSCHDGTVAVGDIGWWDAAKPATPLDTTKHAWPDKHNVGARDGIAGNMSGNHPVAMPYPLGGVANTYNGSTNGPGTTYVEWQDPPVSPVRVFNDNAGSISAGAVAGKTGIECSSCHDPHNKASTGDYFLRGTLAGNDTDYICLKCHKK